MLSLDELCNLLNDLPVPPLDSEILPLDDISGRMLAQDITVPFDQPREALSAMDGYALRFEDLLNDDGQIRSDCMTEPDVVSPTGASSRAPFVQSQRVPAGSVPSDHVPGTVARIFTGAMLPPGSDTVVMQENVTVLDDGAVLFNAVPVRGSHVRQPGDELRAGAQALHAGAVLTPGAVALLASMGLEHVAVYRRVRVGLLFTGDELRQPGESLARGQIYNSNRWMWKALLQRPYVDLVDIGQVPDRLDATRAALRQLCDCDLILSSGGVSVGEEDHVRAAVEQEGRLQAWKVAMKPGKPIAVGQVIRPDGTHALFVGLPGNPVSSFAGFLLLLRPLLWRLAAGLGACTQPCDSRLTPLPLTALAQMRTASFAWAKPDAKRTEFLRARLNADGSVALHPNQQSAALAAVAWSDGFVRVNPGLAVSPGDPVPFLPFSSLMLP